MSNRESVERVNVVLMIISCAAAFVAPFHLFLFAYAVLGPLHYLTQISWLHDRGYFARRKTDALLLLALTALAVVGPSLTSDPDPLRRSGPVIFVTFAGALAMAFTPSVAARVVI